MAINILGGNSNATGGANEPTLGSATSILESNGDDTYYHLSATYDPNLKPIGIVDGSGAEGITVEATDSIFNPFYLFRYAKYGNIEGPKGYSAEYHRDVKPVNQNSQNGGTQKDTVSLISESKKQVQNPTASQIIEWTATHADQSSGNTVGPYPYQWNDFLWCKWYGRIPNNRLLTLRRYTIPVEDNLQVANEKMPMIPIAQAVTWWGGETGNTLDKVLGLTYGFNWTEKTAEVTDVAGNEIETSKLLDTMGVGNDTLRKFLLSSVLSASDNPYATSGLDKKLQDWVKDAYTKGPYWNRVLGPINVINKTQIRNTGYTFTHDITLNFSYKLRSFNNINPKIAMLDLITNFLALTYNKAEFWGGSIRYFQKTGLILAGLPQADFEKADYIAGIKKTIEYTLQRVQEKAQELSKIAATAGKAITKDQSVDQAIAELESSPTARNVAGSWVKDLIQGPLSMRALLDGRAVGEWHLTVGNPIDPIAVIGNLCLKSTKITFSDSLGLDDFPTEVNFTVTLNPGRPRAKQDIESMFNAGGGDLSFTPLPLPSSAFNSYGERNSKIANDLRSGNSATPNAADQYKTGMFSAAEIVNQSDKSTLNKTNSSSTVNDAKNIANYFRTNVTRAYGAKFGSSKILEDYFIQLKTKD